MRRIANGLTGIVTIPVTPDSGSDPWGTMTINPAEDIAALWPDMDHRDFGLYELTLSAVSTGDLVEGYFDYLRFNRSISGEAFFKQQADMGTALAARYRSVVQQQGLEVSLSLPHVNWFGTSVSIPDYGSTSGRRQYDAYLAQNLIPKVHASGGLISYNHPFGYAGIPELPQSQQDAMLVQTANGMLPTSSAPAALGADLLEVGYALRQGMDLAHHVALWDIMSRNALFLTGNGTNDDHFGQNWLGPMNNWFSSVWAPGTSIGDLLAALAAGRAWCASLSRYRGSLDLLVDGTVPMGSVSVSKVVSRKLVASGQPQARGQRDRHPGAGQAADPAGHGRLRRCRGPVGEYQGDRFLLRQPAHRRVGDAASRHRQGQLRAHPGARLHGDGGRPVQPGVAAAGRAARRHPGPAPDLSVTPGGGWPRPGRAGRGRSRGRYPPPAAWGPPRHGSPRGYAGSAG